MQKKHLVFISSTLDDVKAERRELVRIVYGMGAIPVTMDAFDITQEQDRKLIFKAIEECGYFLNLTAHRLGEAVGKQFALELEYAHAVKAGVPVLPLIIGEKARWKASKKEKTDAARAALEAFKKKLKSHNHGTWTGTGDLKESALTLLNREITLCPRQGWVPSGMAAEPPVANELARLIRENRELKNLLMMKGADTAGDPGEQVKHTLKVLSANHISLSFYYVDGENWENPRNFRLLRLFRLLVPELSAPKTAAEISHFLGNILNPNLEKTVRKDYPTPSNTIKKIISDFTLLKLVACTGSGENEAWEMTGHGREIFATYRLHQMNRALKPKQG